MRWLHVVCTTSRQVPLQGVPTKYGMTSNRDKSLSTKRNFETSSVRPGCVTGFLCKFGKGRIYSCTSSFRALEHERLSSYPAARGSTIFCPAPEKRHCVGIAIGPGLSHGKQSLQIALLRVEQLQCAGLAEPELIATDLDALFGGRLTQFRRAHDSSGRLDRLERIRNVAKGTIPCCDTARPLRLDQLSPPAAFVPARSRQTGLATRRRQCPKCCYRYARRFAGKPW